MATNSEQINALLDRAEQGTKEVFESERYAAYLKAMSKFHNYSYRNILLIASQKPEATLVAGYAAWQKNFNRHVRKGERGIQIIGYAPRKQQVEQVKRDAAGRPVLGENGTALTETTTKLIPAYTPMYVFDLSQTEGEPLPELVNDLDGSVESYLDLFLAIDETSPFQIVFEEMDGDEKGYCIPSERKIAIRQGLSERQTIKTLIHEVTHADLHAPDDSLVPGEKKDRRSREIEAESVAFVVCSHYGIDTSDYSFPYLAFWSSDKDLKELQDSLGAIQKQAGELIDRIDTRLGELQQAREAEKEQMLPAPQLDQAPVVSIIFSQSDQLPPGQSLPLQEADRLFAQTDQQNAKAGEQEQVLYSIEYQMDGEARSYEGQQVLGKGDGGVIDHLRGYWETELSPRMVEQHLANGNADLIDKAKDAVASFVNYLDAHKDLGELEERTKAQQAEGKNGAAYKEALLSYVQDSREALNAGKALPPVPDSKAYGVAAVEKQLANRMEAYSTPAGTDDKGGTLAERSFAIYQPQEERWRLRDYASLEEQGHRPDFAQYDNVYTGTLPPKATLDSIYRQFTVNRPEEYHGRNLAVGDIIVIGYKGEYTATYVDSIGYQPLSRFADQYAAEERRRADAMLDSVKFDLDPDLDREKTREQLGFKDQPMRPSFKDLVEEAKRKAEEHNAEKADPQKNERERGR